MKIQLYTNGKQNEHRPSTNIKELKKYPFQYWTIFVIFAAVTLTQCRPKQLTYIAEAMSCGLINAKVLGICSYKMISSSL